MCVGDQLGIDFFTAEIAEESHAEIAELAAQVLTWALKI